MLLHRIREHLRAENWFAVALDLVVVVVGIFLAFQVDRWYETKRQSADERTYLQALAADMAVTRENIDRTILVCDQMRKAALALRQAASADGDPPSASQLNAWLTELGQLPYPRIIRSTFANLISTGELARIENRSLVLQLIDYYKQVELVDLVIEDQAAVYRTTFEPYVVKNVDFAPIVRLGIAPPGVRSELKPYLHESRVREVLDSLEFQNVIVSKWQATRALQANLEDLMQRLVEIEGAIQASL